MSSAQSAGPIITSSANLVRGLLDTSMRKSMSTRFLIRPAKVVVAGSALRFAMNWLTTWVKPVSRPSHS